MKRTTRAVMKNIFSNIIYFQAFDSTLESSSGYLI
jgi:hypothetical protein